VNKKKQKTLLCWVMGVVSDNAHDPADQKFLRRFSGRQPGREQKPNK
jgi:hypothetical protein